MKTEDDFNHKGWKLFDAIDALIAFDVGCTDSGVSDPELGKAVDSFLWSLEEKESRYILARYARRFLTDESLDKGYGLEDLSDAIRFLEAHGVYI